MYHVLQYEPLKLLTHGCNKINIIFVWRHSVTKLAADAESDSPGQNLNICYFDNKHVDNSFHDRHGKEKINRVNKNESASSVKPLI